MLYARRLRHTAGGKTQTAVGKLANFSAAACMMRFVLCGWVVVAHIILVVQWDPPIFEVRERIRWKHISTPLWFAMAEHVEYANMGFAMLSAYVFSLRERRDASDRFRCLLTSYANLALYHILVWSCCVFCFASGTAPQPWQTLSIDHYPRMISRGQKLRHGFGWLTSGLLLQDALKRAYFVVAALCLAAEAPQSHLQRGAILLCVCCAWYTAASHMASSILELVKPAVVVICLQKIRRATHGRVWLSVVVAASVLGTVWWNMDFHITVAVVFFVGLAVIDWAAKRTPQLLRPCSATSLELFEACCRGMASAERYCMGVNFLHLDVVLFHLQSYYVCHVPIPLMSVLIAGYFVVVATLSFAFAGVAYHGLQQPLSLAIHDAVNGLSSCWRWRTSD
eukprot:TRINITY_DN29368_c0_g1_i2.p1 TRINITY_DN29368_c0_g1~~TRINITY_DN29368_c0_g1_i2.p1  ORF type:complete len:395 (+),score=19.93 TRINITY_DN29368_c0_g1_i2:354-1538(+)